MHHVATLFLAGECPSIQNTTSMGLLTSSTVAFLFHLQWTAIPDLHDAFIKITTNS